MKYEEWLRTVCFQKTTAEANDLARDAWKMAESQSAAEIANLKQENNRLISMINHGIGFKDLAGHKDKQL